MGGQGHLPGQVLTDHSKTRHFLNFALLVPFLPDKHPQLQVPVGKPPTLCKPLTLTPIPANSRGNSDIRTRTTS